MDNVLKKKRKKGGMLWNSTESLSNPMVCEAEAEHE